MKNVYAVFKKQLKDTIKNKEVLIQFVMFPLLTVIMSNAVHIEGMPENYFVTMFAVMYVGMAPLTAISAIISEEKEKNTLRVLMMSNVKPWEYLLGVGGYIWLICMLGSTVFCINGHYKGKTALAFLLLMAVGILVSLLIGAAVGTWSRSQMMATSVAVPLMMIFSFVPMLSSFNQTISKAAKFVYSEQLSRMMGQIQDLHVEATSIFVILINMIIALGFFITAYKKSGLA